MEDGEKVVETQHKGRFKVGNAYSIGNTGGRPPLFKDAQEMADKIAEYLNWADSKKKPDSFSGDGKGIYTLEGCALFLGFASVQSLYDNEKRDSEFSYVINRYRLFLTDWNAQKLYWGGTFAGAMFWLKNWGGYKDEVTNNNNTTVTEVTFTEKKRDE